MERRAVCVTTKGASSSLVHCGLWGCDPGLSGLPIVQEKLEIQTVSVCDLQTSAPNLDLKVGWLYAGGVQLAASGPCCGALQAGQLPSCPLPPGLEGVSTQAPRGVGWGQPLTWPSPLTCWRLQTRTWATWPVGLDASLQVGALVEISKIF